MSRLLNLNILVLCRRKVLSLLAENKHRAYVFGMRGFLQVLSQCCISRRSETYKTGDMGLTKTLREFFLLLHQSPCAKKPCKNNSTCLSGFNDKSDQCLCSSGIKGRTCDEGKIRLNVISFMEKMSVFPSVT